MFLLVALLAVVHSIPAFGHRSAIPLRGVHGVAVPARAPSRAERAALHRRQESATSWCFKWAQQSAIVNGTLYLYGGELKTEASQTSDTWNNDFITLDLTETWQIGSPSLKALPRPSGPPEVALGYLWHSSDALFLYGGQFSWKPPVDPTPFSTWRYDITSGDWHESSDPQTQGGQSADSEGEPVHRASEGAGVTVPQLGRGYYFGGHQDGYTTPGWSQSVWRIYLQSMLEFTFPGEPNEQVNGLGDGDVAGPDGVYRNITDGGLQSEAGFTKRADGLLVHVPGFGENGILLALAGGTNETFTQMNTVNVFDIATSEWYTQATSGETPEIRVNPCAVVAAAPDGSSTNVYMWGGQDLLPYGNQKQRSDMWILTVPAFRWIQVDQGGQSVPDGRSGHTCDIWNGQMISVGGYLGNKPLTCESPGIYTFDLSNLEWVQQYTALSAETDSSKAGAENSAQSSNVLEGNPFNQQLSQIATDEGPGGLHGSYGYTVPQAVYKVIGGGADGGATVTTPIATATAGPLKTGSPVTYTVTNRDGETEIQTGNPSGDGVSSGSSGRGPNIAAIVVGVVCGLLAIAVCYLLFCLFVYRKQLRLYKQHVEMSQRHARGEKPTVLPWTAGAEGTDSSDNGERRELGLPLLGDTNTAATPSSSSPYTSTRAGGSDKRPEDQRSEARDSTEDLMAGQEPTFVGVLLNPRRSLRIVNRD